MPGPGHGLIRLGEQPRSLRLAAPEHAGGLGVAADDVLLGTIRARVARWQRLVVLAVEQAHQLWVLRSCWRFWACRFADASLLVSNRASFGLALMARRRMPSIC